MRRPPPVKRPTGWHLSRNQVRIGVFVLAMAILIYAGSGPRPW